MTIGRRSFGLTCLCLLALTAIAGTGTAAAAECPNEAIRIAQGATRLPDCRAYERVSPADSAGGVVGVDTNNRPLFGAIGADGDGAAFGSSSAVGEAERSPGLLAENLARRTADGWRSFNVTTTTEPSVLMDPTMSPGFPVPSPDMSRMMFRTTRSLGPPNMATGANTYLSAPEGKGPPIWLSHAMPGQVQPPGAGAVPLGGSPDFSSGYFWGQPGLTEPPTTGFYFFEGSTLHSAGLLPSGAANPQGVLPAGTGQAGTTTGEVILAEVTGNQVSVDGSKLFFVSPASGTEPKQLYVEEGGAPGRLVSHDLLGGAASAGITSRLCGSLMCSFANATPDGSRVVFRSESALTAGAPVTGVKTYRAEITPSAITLTYLPAVTGEVLKVDHDASSILFSTPGSVTGTTSYYVWDEGRPTAPYAVATDLSGRNRMPESAFSADGDALAFTSQAEVVPGIAPRVEVFYTQVYRWTRQSETATCISCRRDGGAPGRFGAHVANNPAVYSENPAFPPTGNGTSPDPANQSTVVGNRKISADGSLVFFDTSDPLDPARDVNGTRDVYMWEDGHDYLLTSGRGDTPSLILDSSEDGDDVMFVTKDGLVPSDTNGTYDVYDARVDGGFAEPVKESCEGPACQASRTAPAAASPGSRDVSGPGNQRQAHPAPVKATQAGKPGKVAQVRVTVPAAGSLKLTGNLIQSKSRAMQKKGTVTLKVALTKAGKKKLAAKGSLTAKATATFRDREGHTKKNTVTLRFRQGGHR